MIRPVAAEISQRFGDNPTRNLPASSWLIQTFGNYQPDGHTGEDYACPVGTPVRAVTSGTVLHIGWMGGTYAQNPWWVQPSFAGYCAVIDHGSFVGIYGHCQDGSAKVSKGDRVTEGQVFILSGNTGGSTGPHLHFEVLPDGYVLNSTFYGRIDPEPLFATISAQSATITPLEEGFLMALTDDEQRRILAAADRINGVVTDPRAEVLTTNHIDVVATSAASKVLNTPIARGGVGAELGAGTNLGAVVAWFDSAVLGLAAAINSQAAASGATPEQVIDAVKQALATGVVKVDVSVGGGK